MEFINPFPGKNPGDEITNQELINVLRLSICAEHDATQLYDTIAEYVNDPKIKKIMKDVADEEQVHIGEFQYLLEIIEKDEKEKTEKGRQEVKEKLGTQETEEDETEEGETVSEDVEIILNNKRFLLEKGDKIFIESTEVEYPVNTKKRTQSAIGYIMKYQHRKDEAGEKARRNKAKVARAAKRFGISLPEDWNKK